MKTKIVMFSFLVAGLCAGFSQGFVNLNFENATIVPVSSSPYYPYVAYLNQAIPGWSVTGVTFIPTNEIIYNTLSTGSPCVALLNATNSFEPNSVIDGNYSINLYNGVSISQAGLVPANAVSILFKAQAGGFLGNQLLLSLNGQNIPYFALATGSNYTLFGADISGFAGQTEDLAFSVPYGENSATIDDIQFSPMSVPEVSQWSLFVMCGLFLGWKQSISMSSK